MIIPTPQHFSYRECLIFLNRSPLENLFSIEENCVLRALKFENDIFLFRAQNIPGAGLRVDFPLGEPAEKARQTVNRFLIEWLDLDRDLNSFYRMAPKNAVLRNLVQRYHGLRLIGIPDFFEALCWSVIGQQINLRFAYTLKKRLVENYGEKISVNHCDYWLFPEPEILAGLSPERLMQLQFSRNKAEYLLGIARGFAAGEISKTKMLNNGQNLAVMREKLLQIRGVGEWTADYVLMKCFRIPTVFPANDAGLHNALKIQLGLSHKPSLPEIKKLAAGWNPWEAYATFYLWRSLI